MLQTYKTSYFASAFAALVFSSTMVHADTVKSYDDQSTDQNAYFGRTEMGSADADVIKLFNDPQTYFNVPISMLTESSPLGYVKGDWKKPIQWNNSKARQANYGDGVTIGIMDTPINCLHENLKTTGKRTCKNYGFTDSGTFTSNDREHGSNAAGVAAGTGGYGLASNANIVGVAVFDDNGWYLSEAQYNAAVDFLVNTKNAKVINWSFGVGYTPGSNYHPLDDWDVNAARIAKNKALIVKAAGNDPVDYDSVRIGTVKRNVLKSYLNNVILVGALNPTGTSIASFSTTPGEGCFVGKKETKCTKNNKYKYYFIVAPGYVNTTAGSGNGSNNTQGTSFSAPIVAGAAALIQSRWPRLKPHQVRDILLKTATDMGRRGVDNVYGRGALNISRALKPVRGRVGGVRVKSNNALVFNRVASVGEFSQDIKVRDAYGRDFEAVGYASGNQAVIKTIDILPNGDLSIHLNEIAVKQDDMSFGVLGVSVGGLSYFSEISGNNEYTSFELDDRLLGELPSSLLALNVGNQAAIYKGDDFAIFAFTPNKKNNSMVDTSTIGVSKSWLGGGNLTFNSTAAIMTEKGFHGLSSVKGFGFENKNKSVFFQAGVSHNSQFGSFDIGLNHHRSTAGYSSDNIRWSSLGVTQLQAGFSKAVGDTRVGIKAVSGLDVAGKLKSSIKDLRTLDDFYHKQSKIAVNLNTKFNNQSILDLNLSTEKSGTLDISYTFNF